MYNECPKKLEFRYILNIPLDEHEYFEIWKNVEEYLRNVLIMKGEYGKWNISEHEIKLAKAIYENKHFRELIEWKTLTYQKHYITNDVEWFTDIETDDAIIDIKTSSVSWNSNTIQKYKYQAKMYLKESWKKLFYFVIVNKKNYRVQVIKITTDTFEDLKEKIHEIKTAFELGVFPKKEWLNCYRCDYKTLCNTTL